MRMGLPIWPGLDRSAELESLRCESRRRADERRKELMTLIEEEEGSAEQAWVSVRRTCKGDDDLGGTE